MSICKTCEVDISTFGDESNTQCFNYQGVEGKLEEYIKSKAGEAFVKKALSTGNSNEACTVTLPVEQVLDCLIYNTDDNLHNLLKSLRRDLFNMSKTEVSKILKRYLTTKEGDDKLSMRELKKVIYS